MNSLYEEELNRFRYYCARAGWCKAALNTNRLIKIKVSFIYSRTNVRLSVVALTFVVDAAVCIFMSRQ